MKKIYLFYTLLLSHKTKSRWLRMYYVLESYLEYSHSRWLNLITRLNQKSRQAVAVFQDALTSRDVSARTRLGVSLVLIAPFIKVLYKVFPKLGFGEYLINTSLIQIPNTIEPNLPVHFYSIYYWVWSNAELWWVFVAFLGIYFLVDKPEAKTLVVMLLSYTLFHSINRMTSDSLEEFHALFKNFIIYLPCALGSVVVLIKVLEKMIHQKYHGEEISNEKRIVGIIKLPNMTKEQKWDLLEKYNLINP